MATQVQFRGGSSTEHNSFTGAAREVTVDTTKDTVVVHDGSTTGGHPLQKQYPALGSVSAPTYTFVGDTNTGIYSPGADQVAISTSGTGRLFIDASGNVGVGYSTPGNFAGGDLGASRSLVVGDGTATTNVNIFSDSTGYGHLAFGDGTSGTSTYAGLIQYYHTADSMAFYTAASERLRIDSSGNVGIGTSSPSYIFETSQGGTGGVVVGASLATSGNGGSGRGTGLLFKAPGSSSAVEVARIDGRQNAASATANSASLNFMVADSGGTLQERITVNNSGNVGIGMSSPSKTLTVNGDLGLGTNSTISTASSSGSLQLQGGGTYPGGNILLSGGSGANDIRFGTSGASDTSTERMRIDNYGRLLVGTSSTSDPKAKLKVDGSVNIGAGSGNTVTLANGATGTVATPVRGYSYVNISHSDSTSDGLLLLVFANTTALTIVSTVHSNAGARYTASVSGRDLQVTNALGSGSVNFYASCMTLAWGSDG